MTITIIGLGLIGGSLAIDIRRLKLATRIIGVENNSTNAEAASFRGLWTSWPVQVERANLCCRGVGSTWQGLVLWPLVFQQTPRGRGGRSDRRCRGSSLPVYQPFRPISPYPLPA